MNETTEDENHADVGGWLEALASCYPPEEVVLDYIYEEGNTCFSLHDLSFWNYCKERIDGLTERKLNAIVKGLYDDGRLDRYRQYNEPTRPAGVPKWMYVYR